MLYPILTVVCLLLRGQLSLQRKDMYVDKDSNKSSNGINTSISPCSVEELSKLLTNRIAMSKAIELAAAQQSQTEKQFVHNILQWPVNEPINSNYEKQNQVLLSQDNELHSIIGNPPPIPLNSQNFHPIINNHFKPRGQLPDSIPRIGLIHERRQFRDRNSWPITPSQYSLPLFLPHRSLKPPPDAKIKLEFKNKIREVAVTVSPLMSVLEALKQAEIKFQRNLKLPLEEDLISFSPSPTLGCIIVDKVSTIQSENSMMWKITIINQNGEIEYSDYCLPSKEEIFIKPGSTIQLVYTSLQMVKDIN